MGSASVLLWGVVFSAVGLAFFTYGKSQKAIIPLVTGLSLLLFPYFVSNVYVMVAIGGVLIAVPYFVRL